MSVETPKLSMEGLALQRIVTEVGGEISDTLKPRLFSHLVEQTSPSITIGFYLRQGQFAGNYSFTEHSFIVDKMALVMDLENGFIGAIKTTKRKGQEVQHIGIVNPNKGKIKLVTNSERIWHLDKTGEDPRDSYELEFLRSMEYLDDQQTMDTLVYMSGLLKEVDNFLNSDENVIHALLSRASLINRGR